AGVNVDITKRKQAEQEQQRLAAQRQLALDAARLGWWHYDPASKLVTWDERYREIFGVLDRQRPIEEILTRLHPDDVPPVRVAIEAALNPVDPKPFFAEFRILRDDRSVRWVEARGIATFEGKGDDRRPTSLVGTVQDITERKQFQAELERLVAERTAKLQELVTELEHFSYTITHDMRAPLRAMQGFADLMSETCGSCSEQEPKGFLRRIRTSASRMDSLITDALNYSRTVRQELTLLPVDAGALLRGMLDSYPELQPSKARVEIKGDIPLVMGNEAGLTQCFSNLLNNAVKFVKPGNSPQIRIWGETRGQWVRIWIEDDGIGIPQSMNPRIFDMFSRGHQSYEGTGIGLALVRKVMDRMGGKVGVESQEGRGSRFWLDLKSGDTRAAYAR
ncbi:MAG TPA: HAMP domain-containing sensor histidine kinase, partial [Verrucomicrobiae bacterium]